ncbi:MAG TPA: hypothetical protein PKW80_14355 [Bacteroidales bacterium]|nr:hypothetical protein [Bacteroidales bacterium]
MDKPKNGQLLRLFDYAKRGSKGFRDDSVKPLLDIFFDFASQCKIVTELGIDSACSTLAFLASGCEKVYSYNVVVSQNALRVRQAAEDDGMFFRHITKDSLKVRIKMTDMLFIDTDHWYGQIKAELEHHHMRVKKWIMMHDTETFGIVNPFDGRPGMKAAIYEFLEEHPEWQIREHIETSHGLTILERQTPIKRKWWLGKK